PLEIAIIGGGIGGLSLLLGILEHCSSHIIRPHLYESAQAFSEIGAGIGIGPNAAAAMSIVSPALHRTYLDLGTDAETVLVQGQKHSVWNEIRLGMDGRSKRLPLKAGDLITTLLFQGYKKGVHRAKFLDGMIELLPGGDGRGFVSFRKKCTDIEFPSGGERVKIHFADGTSSKADMVVGCDGVKSRVRQILLTRLGDTENISSRFTGKYAYRGLVPMDRAVEALGPVARKAHMLWGYDGHFVLFPIDKGQTLNVVAFKTKQDGLWNEAEWVLPATVEQALEDYKEWPETVQNLVKELHKPDIWALFEHPPAKSYWDGEGKLCLLGDCAHASTPHQGAGAGMAIEDAAVLSTLLGKIKEPTPHALKAALAAYDAVRRPRSQRLVTTSRDAASLYQFQKEGIWDDKTRMTEDIQTRYRWIWDFDLEAHFQEALELM
ncbi:salicylate 1-hydroxylase-like protein, partial [Glonium stellatum]